MIVNISSAPVVIGRFRILPGAKFPDVPKTSEETLAVEKLLKKGILKETAPKESGAPRPSQAAKGTDKAQAPKPEAAKPETPKAETAKPEAPKAETAKPETPKPEAAKSENK